MLPDLWGALEWTLKLDWSPEGAPRGRLTSVHALIRLSPDVRVFIFVPLSPGADFLPY